MRSGEPTRVADRHAAVGCARAGRPPRLSRCASARVAADGRHRRPLLPASRHPRVRLRSAERQITPEQYWSRFHGNDERIDVESLRLSADMWEQLARDFLNDGLSRVTEPGFDDLDLDELHHAAVVQVAAPSARRCCRRGSRRWTSRSPRRSERRSSRSQAEGDYGYPVDEGPDSIEALGARRLGRRFGWQPDPALGFKLTDVMRGVINAIVAFTEPGDGVLVTTPIYPPFLGAIADNHRRVVEARLRPIEEGCALDVDALERAAERRAAAPLVQPAQPLRAVVQPKRARRGRCRSSSSTTSRRRRRDPRRPHLSGRDAHSARVARR